MSRLELKSTLKTAPVQDSNTQQILVNLGIMTYCTASFLSSQHNNIHGLGSSSLKQSGPVLLLIICHIQTNLMQ
jgi:hypothetical protein